MKKNFFLFAMLASMAANATVKVTPLSTDYSTNKVTFKVEWTGTPSAPHNNRVWVWIDFCPVAGTTPATSFSTATISNPAKTGGNGTITGATTRGFFIEYSSATNAGTTVTATLSNAAGKFNWCAYGSDFPPNAVDNSGGGYDLRGTPPFIINGSIEWSSYTYSGGTINTLTDATGCPGVLCGKDGESAGLLNCCIPGTTNCSGTCKTTGTYTSNDGACTNACNTAYVQVRNQCGNVINATSSTYYNSGCRIGCAASWSQSCRDWNQDCSWIIEELDKCQYCCTAQGYRYYNLVSREGSSDCSCCN
ncbi:MAG: hypothetical protein LBU42_02995 [Prevotellaceae bacterium]|jgi:hypothetical protein|nr:hypothetical protein [Prevotellaceae bacterium]